MRRILGLLVVVLSWPNASHAVPISPNFSSGKLDSTTTQRQVISEVIVSEDFNTGWVHSVSGTGIKPTTGVINPTSHTEIRHTTLNGGTSTWTGLDINTSPDFSLVTDGGAFQYTSSYQGPGLRNRTQITRTSEIETTIQSSSVFSQ